MSRNRFWQGFLGCALALSGACGDSADDGTNPPPAGTGGGAGTSQSTAGSMAHAGTTASTAGSGGRAGSTQTGGGAGGMSGGGAGTMATAARART